MQQWQGPICFRGCLLQASFPSFSCALYNPDAGADMRSVPLEVAMPGASSEITRLLGLITQGQQDAVNELVPLLYRELRALAGKALQSERTGHTLQPTALVHELYFRLVGQTEVKWQDRTHFLAIASSLMRRILCDHARRRHAEKRGNYRKRVTLRDDLVVSGRHQVDVLIIDELLARLATLDARQAQLVELRFFSGLSVEEIAAIMQLSPTTIKREWNSAKAWLHREMRQSSE